jgi:AraC-like DNA-binding protein
VARVSLRRADRVSAILERLAAEHSLNAADLAEEFGVSSATLRRDLQMLEDQKLLSRTHGGALAQDVAYELPVRYRGGRNRDQKRRIAAAAAALLPKGPLTMGLTGGTTTSEVNSRLSDLNAREVGLMLPLLALMLFMGVYPQPFLSRSRASIEAARQTVSGPSVGPAEVARESSNGVSPRK